YKNMPYEFLQAFAPITQMTSTTNVLVVHPSVQVKSLKEVIALAKAKPGQLNYSSAGIGSTTHMAMELLKTMAHIDIVHIPYKGSGPALADLMGGQVDVMFDNLTSSIGFIRGGKLRALAVTTNTRYPELPDLPTVQETVPGYEATAWFGIVAPTGTPRDAIMRINGEVNRALAQADVKEKLSQQGALARSWTPEEFGSFIHNEIVKWAKVVKASGAKVE
ncbi:MAG TPA: tripartite tricarboxylate transporter substrate-binding protein, partial [Bradyrhizobium sp.]|nr:tripartite tricarboxylate transporter substrate-binding protein [Bradyrhizobium sp.]